MKKMPMLAVFNLALILTLGSAAAQDTMYGEAPMLAALDDSDLFALRHY